MIICSGVWLILFTTLLSCFRFKMFLIIEKTISIALSLGDANGVLMKKIFRLPSSLKVFSQICNCALSPSKLYSVPFLLKCLIPSKNF